MCYNQPDVNISCANCDKKYYADDMVSFNEYDFCIECAGKKIQDLCKEATILEKALESLAKAFADVCDDNKMLLWSIQGAYEAKDWNICLDVAKKMRDKLARKI